jgi:uncharacterized protein (TIGR02117 family)
LKKRSKKLLLFGVLSLLTGCAMWGERKPALLVNASRDRVVYVVGRGFHTDIGFDVAELGGTVSIVAGRFPAARTVLVGFGDRRFITTRSKWLGTWLLTLLPGEGALLVTGLRTTPEEAFDSKNVVRLHVAESQFENILAYVNASFALDHGGPVWIGNGPYLGSLFYASSRTYDLLDTCNTWTAAAIRSGGLDEKVSFTLFAGQTLRGARRLAAQGY